MCSVQSQYKGGGLRPPPQKGRGLRPPPFAVSFVVALNTGHILLLRRLVESQDMRLVETQTCAVLRARTCALFRANAKEATKGGGRPKAARPPLWRRPKAASFVLALNKAHVLALNTAHVLRLNRADVLALKRHLSCVSTVRYAQCSEPTQRKPQRGAAEGRPLCGGGRRLPPLCWL